MPKTYSEQVEEFLKNSYNKEVTEAVDGVLQQTPIGAISNAIGTSYFGINHQQTAAAIPINRDHFGYTFFTRPVMNFTAGNLRHSRVMAPFLTEEENSTQRYIRCMLDPWLTDGIVPGQPQISCPFIDPHQAFIPILTNHLVSISGWPDAQAPMFIADEGLYKETYGFVDGVTDYYGTYDIIANFRSTPGNPITTMMLAWIRYASYVYEGLMIPYPEMIISNRIDYCTRIYRLVTDPTKRFVTGICACGAAIPKASPISGIFNYESDRPFVQAGDQISVPFAAFGAIYQDDILIWAFNKTVRIFNPDMHEKNFTTKKNTKKGTVEVTHRSYKKVPAELLVLFNHRGYPRINPDTYELEWWVTAQEYAATTSFVK